MFNTSNNNNEKDIINLIDELKYKYKVKVNLLSQQRLDTVVVLQGTIGGGDDPFEGIYFPLSCINQGIAVCLRT